MYAFPITPAWSRASTFSPLIYVTGEVEGTTCVGKNRDPPYYVAPEVLMGRGYNEKVDVWSRGVILYIMLAVAGVPSFYSDGPVLTFEAVLQGNVRFPPKIFRSVSAETKDLFRKMLCRDVFRRFSAEQAT